MIQKHDSNYFHIINHGNMYHIYPREIKIQIIKSFTFIMNELDPFVKIV